jgi:hypothetical protein
MKSKRGSPSSGSSRPSERPAAPWVFATLLAWGALCAAFVYLQGWTLYYGDAEAHLNIARRILDSRKPGYEQIGTVWLPLPHVLTMPFAQADALWRSGIAGAVVSWLCFALGGTFLFLAARRVFSSRAAGVAAAGAWALNPNLLYLAGTPMTEPLSLCCVAGLVHFLTRFRGEKRVSDAVLAGFCALCGALTRYETWFLLPAAALAMLFSGGERRWRGAMLFSLVAGLGPLYWLAHNQVFYSNALEFYNGQWSARAIYQRALDQGGFRYPGDHDFAKAWLYYRTAARLCLGQPLFWTGAVGLVVAALRRASAGAALLALVPAFYVLSLYSSGTPIFVPELWPNSFYNTRYGLAALPAACFGAAALIAPGFRGAIAFVLVLAAAAPWIAYPRKDNWVCWKESEVNSAGRRAWTREAAQYLAPRYKSGAGIFMPFGDATGILRTAGIPLRESLHEGDGLVWDAAAARPELFLREEWAIAFAGDRVSAAARKMRYECVRMYAAPGIGTLEIWRRIRQ